MPRFFDAFESLGQYHDHWASVILSAPDRFSSFDETPLNQQETLREAFDVLRSGFHLVKVKEARRRRIMQELIEMSYEAYSTGDAKAGAHILQECEGMIWPSRAQRIKYAVAAEQRAFGEVVTYAGVKVSSFPYEGTELDLSSGMKKLYAAAQDRCTAAFARHEDFKPFVLLLGTDESIREIKSRSRKAADAEVQSLAKRGEAQAYLRAEVVVSGMHGVLIYDIEAVGQPHVSVRCLVSDYVCESSRFHLDEPNVLRPDA